MEDLIQEPERAYRNMIRDIYGLGSVLETKYRLLRTLVYPVYDRPGRRRPLFLAVFAGAAGVGSSPLP